MAEEKQNNELSYLDEIQDTGFENMKAGDISIPLLLISQALSKNVADGTMPVGHFYNSVTGRDYGTQLKIVVCHMDKMWYEWKPNQGGLVGRYPVGGLEGVVGDKYTGMTHGENKVEEKMVYLIYLPDFPEDGLLVFSSNGGNMKYLKAWNTMMQYLRTPFGKRQAPIFAGIWELSVNKDKNKQGNVYYSCNNGEGKAGVKFVDYIPQQSYNQYVLPARRDAAQAIAIADMRDDSEEPTALPADTQTSDF